MKRIATIIGTAWLLGCASDGGRGHGTETTPEWAIAIHGGAGVIDRDAPEAERRSYEESLRRALAEGRRRLEAGEAALDVVEAVVCILEDDPLFNAGKGAVFTEDGLHELDACIMDGRKLATGAVTGVKTIRHPIRLARAVMEKSRHVLFAGDGAERFADGLGLERVENTWFDTDARREQWLRAKAAREAAPGKGTVGCVALDAQGHLAAATSTGGMTNKRFGRVGDTPIVGAGTYANDANCAVSGTGTGEQFIRHTVARDVAALWEYRRLHLEEACSIVVFEKLEKDDGGVIAVSRAGEIAMIFNGDGMFRGAADSLGRFEVSIH